MLAWGGGGAKMFKTRAAGHTSNGEAAHLGTWKKIIHFRKTIKSIKISFLILQLGQPGKSCQCLEPLSTLSTSWDLRKVDPYAFHLKQETLNPPRTRSRKIVKGEEKNATSHLDSFLLQLQVLTMVKRPQEGCWVLQWNPVCSKISLHIQVRSGIWRVRSGIWRVRSTI